MSGRTLTSGVDNTTFMIDKLAAECSPLQWMREFTQNAIDAVRLICPSAAPVVEAEQSGELTLLDALNDLDRTGEAAKAAAEHQILWDVDERILRETGVRKICVIDTGSGMTGAQMLQLLNKLSSSSRTQGMTDNFGVGAKIAAARRSPAGVLYQSWVDGQGAQVLWWRDPDSGDWGLYQWVLDDGTHAHVAPVDLEDKPSAIGEHGTKVTLFGMDDDEDTVLPPANIAAPMGWMVKYLNTRYFTVPEGVNIRALETTNLDDNRGNRRVVRGMEHWLSGNSIASGVVQMHGAAVRWWILTGDSRRQDGARYNASGHTALLFQGELYETTTGTPSRRRLQEFGIHFGTSRVVLYVEPLGAAVQANTARTMLLADGEPMPWSDWAADFREQMPPELADFIDSAGSAVRETDADDARKKLEPVMNQLRNVLARPQLAGPLLASEAETGTDSDPTSSTAGAGSGGDGSDGAGNGGSAGGGAGGSGGGAGGSGRGSGGAGGRRPGTGGAGGAGTGGARRKGLKAGRSGTPAVAVDADLLPTVMWVSQADGTRDPGDLVDRAGRFLLDQNVVLMNEDFAFFGSICDGWSGRYAGRLPRQAIMAEVRAQVSLLVAQRTVAICNMRGAHSWSEDDVARALSEEAITAIVFDPYWLRYSLGRSLGSQHGSPPNP